MITTQPGNRFQMHTGHIFFSFMVTTLLLCFSPLPSQALQVSISSTAAAPGDDISVDVTVEQYTDELLAGAALTLTYDASRLTLTAVDSDFFDLFVNQWNALNPVPSPLPPTSVDVGGQTYDRPLLETTTTGQTLLAGVRVQGGQPPALFTLSFTVNGAAPAGTYDIVITPTTLNNTAAGYDAAGEQVPMLVGLGSGSNPYPAYTPTLVDGSVTVVSGMTDSDNDGIDDAWETTHFGDLTTANETTDWDGDGYSDRQEYINETNSELDPAGAPYDPKVVNASGGIGYVQKYSVGGDVSGLATGNTLTLQNNGTDDLTTVAPGGGFTFAEKLLDGSGYDVTVLSQPTSPRQSCTVAAGSGIIAQADVTDVAVTCVNTYTVGGTVSGLASGTSLTLQNNGGDDLVISGDGSFTFATALVEGSPYGVTVLSLPTAPDQVCTVSSGAGVVGQADVTNVAVTCVNTYTVGGTVSGLASGTSLTLRNNGGDDLVLSGDGNFTFGSVLVDGSTYTVLVSQQPVSPNQTCTVSAGTGTILHADVTGVTVVCVTETYTIGGTVSGLLSGTSLVLQNNGGDDLVIDSDGDFTFAAPLDDETPYEVLVSRLPVGPDQTCEVVNSSGTLAGKNVIDIEVRCEKNPFPWNMFLPAISGNNHPRSAAGVVNAGAL